MNIQYFQHWSSFLNRNMEYKVYGSGSGKAVLFIPCQGGRFFDFEAFHMIDYWAKWIEEGHCTVYAVDSIDNEAWAAMGADNRWRIENHENWIHYVIYPSSGRHTLVLYEVSKSLPQPMVALGEP